MLKSKGKIQVGIYLIAVLMMGVVGIASAISVIGANFPELSQTDVQTLISIPCIVIIPVTLIVGKLMQVMSKKLLAVIGIILFLVGGIVPAFMTSFLALQVLRGVDPDRITRANRCDDEVSAFYDAMMANVNPWCVASVPIPSWAKKVFPELPEQEAMDKLWDAIFTSVRISGKGDAVARWREHVALLKSRIAKLNDLHFTSLYYQNSLGTSLNIKLPETHVWAGGDNTSRAGFPFVANMPTEEVFTAPLRDGIDGVVYAALPLVHNGNIIENFHFVIKDGKIVEAHAEKGEDILKAAIAEDEGASYFGEVALVPYDSPISNQKILFYNTLFDENAACHLAFGEAYPECVKGGEAMSKEELKAAGLNDSNTHVDFMVGTADLSIIGTTKDGREIPVFVNGNFAL